MTGLEKSKTIILRKGRSQFTCATFHRLLTIYPPMFTIFILSTFTNLDFRPPTYTYRPSNVNVNCEPPQSVTLCGQLIHKLNHYFLSL